MSRSIEPEARQPERLTSDRRQDDPLPRLRETIERVTQDRPSMSELINRLEQAGIRAVPSIQKSGRLNGMSYAVDGTLIKGSDLGRAYTAQGLQKSRGVRYDPQQDHARLAEAALRAREYPATCLERFQRPNRVGPDRLRDRASRMREYEGLTATQRAALREIGRFRTVAAEDFLRILYHGDRGAWREDFTRLASQKLLEERSVVVAMHSKSHVKTVRSLSVLAITKRGKNLLRRCDRDARASHQALYAGIVKPREVAHDTAIYRMYQAETARIQADGGRVKRVVLDFELKKRAYSPLAKARHLAPPEYARKQAQVAQENGLKVVHGKIRFPDLRIEYETAGGEAARVDLELATEHYRGEHMAAKSRAGFKIYAESASHPGGSYGRSPALDPDHITEIFSF
jgi:hypothetical protein